MEPGAFTHSNRTLPLSSSLSPFCLVFAFYFEFPRLGFTHAAAPAALELVVVPCQPPKVARIVGLQHHAWLSALTLPQRQTQRCKHQYLHMLPCLLKHWAPLRCAQNWLLCPEHPPTKHLLLSTSAKHHSALLH